MANIAHLRIILAAVAGLSSLFCPFAANAHSAIAMHQPAPSDFSAGASVQPKVDADATPVESRLVVALNTGVGTGMPKKNNPGVGGVIDRSTPRPTRAASAPDANLPLQFNRIPDTSTFAGTVGLTAETAIPDSDGGPVLYTIMERPSRQQVRPVLYRPAAAARPNNKGSAKRYCTVTEVLRAAAAACQ